LGIGLEDASLGLSEMIAGREPNGVDFLAETAFGSPLPRPGRGVGGEG